MRILITQPGPDFSVHDVFVGWAEALRQLGCHVAEFNLSDRLTFYERTYLHLEDNKFRRAVTNEQAVELAVNGVYAALYQTRPDVLLIVSGFFMTERVFRLTRSHGTRIVIVHTEEPYEHERELGLARFADLNLVNDPVNIEQFRAVAPTYYVPHAYRPDLHKPGPADPDLACDLGFVGTGYPSRRRFFEAMDLSGVDVLLAGNWQGLAGDSPLRKYIQTAPEECLDNAETVRLYRSARCGLNLYRREGESAAGLAMGPREVEMAATGLFFLRDPRPESDSVLHMLPSFTGPGEASELLRWYLDHEDQRRELASRAREAVADRTFSNHAAAMLRLLD